MKTRIALVLFLLLTASAGTARAQANLLGLDASTVQAAPRFYGFKLDYTLYFSTGLNRENYNASFSHWIEPKWQFGKLFFRGTRFGGLALNARITVNNTVAGNDPLAVQPNTSFAPQGTCSNLTPSQQGGQINPNQVERCDTSLSYRATMGDIWLTVPFGGLIPVIPKANISITPLARVIVPTSPDSQYQTMQSALYGGLFFARSFWDRISLSYIFGATKFFHEYTSRAPSTNSAPLGGGSFSPGYSFNSVLQGSQLISHPAYGDARFNPSFTLGHIFILGIDLPKHVGISFIYSLSNQFGYDASEQCGPRNYGGVVTDPCQNAAALNGGKLPGRPHADNQLFWASIDWGVTDWLTLSLNWLTFAPLRKEDNSYRQALISTNYDSFSSVLLGAQISTDTIAKKLFPDKKPAPVKTAAVR